MIAFIGIDYGSKCIGLSWGTLDLGVAVPLQAITDYASLGQVFEQLRRIMDEKGCDAFVIGLPLHMNGQAGMRVREVERFSVLLRQHFSLPIYFVDERLSTYTAQCLVGLKKVSIKKEKRQKRSGIVDSRAASIILQDFLDSKNTMESLGPR
ncbi:MAG: Holliday junction resolvase RuvX [Puniceicoccales bacterium]|jgi:putative Holliday junction resolvase|nr:Holliday junction resolvase RuvX [Puniceicoccales bacterium]